MRTFEVYLNKKKICVAGMDDDCVLTAIIDYVSQDKRRVHLHVGGLENSTQDHVRWQDRKLRVGDEIRIRIASASRADQPIKRFPHNPSQELESKKRFVRLYAKELGWTIKEMN